MNFAIRTTDYCNLDCDYCYAKTDDPKYMSNETVEKVLYQIAEFCDGDVTISWTGGEPLLQSMSYFVTIVKTQKKITNINFTNIIQTNLTLMSEDRMTYFADHNFQIRTSLDLPSQNHDSLRVVNNFRDTMETIKKLQKAGMAVNVNTVVTNRNIHQAKEIYQFLQQQNITSFSVSRFVVQGNGEQNTDLMIQEKGQFGRFLIELFDLWMGERGEQCLERITPLDNIMNACQKHLKQIDVDRPCFHCQDQIFAINPEGMVFPSCNKFLAHPKTCFGSLTTNNLEDILNSEERKTFLAKVGKSTGEVCPTCKYNSICKGGCFFLAYAAGIEEYKDREDFCKGYYFVFDHIVKYLESANLIPQEVEG